MIEKIRASYWLKSGFLSFVSQSSSVVFGFVNFYFLLRVLDKHDFGVWTLFVSVATFMEIIKIGFIASPLVRYSLVERDEYTKILSASLLLNVMITGFQILIVIGLSFFLGDLWQSDDLKLLFLIFIGSMIFLIPATHFTAIQQSKMNFKGIMYANFTRQFVFFLVVMSGFWFPFQDSLWKLAVGHTLSVVLQVLVAYFNVKKFLAFSSEISWKWVKEMARYGKYTFGTNISSTILRNVDIWMLGAILSPAAVTIYNPAVRVANIVELPTISLSSIFFPKLLSRYANEGPSVAREMYEKSVGILFAFMFPVMLFCIAFAEPIVLFVAGKGFDETVNILRITMITGLIIPFNRQVGVTLDAIGRAKTNFYFVLRNAALNVGVSYFYIHHFGTIGAAYGMLTTFVLSFGYNQFYIRKLIGVRFLAIFRNAYGFYRQFILFGLSYLFNKKVDDSES